MNKTEMIIQVPSINQQIAGVWEVPSSFSGQAIVFVSGSGPVDRDGNIPKWSNNLYLTFAEHLHDLGAATFRYDKIGTGKSSGDYNSAGLYDYIEAAAAVLREVKSLPGVEEVVLLGHSEGAMIAPAILEKEPADGLLYLCGTIGTGKEMMEFQQQALAEEVRNMTGVKGKLFHLLNVEKKLAKQHASLNEKIMSSTEPVLRYRGVKLNAKWYREMRGFEWQSFVPFIPEWAVAIEGGRDVQIQPGSAEQLADVAGIDFVVIPDMNHVLRKQATPHTLLGLRKEYKKSFAEQGIHPALLEAIAHFLQKK